MGKLTSFFDSNLLVLLILVSSVVFLFSVLCFWLRWNLVGLCCEVQIRLIKRSGQNNSLFTEKMLVLIYKFEKAVNYLLFCIQPFRWDMQGRDRSFSPRLLTTRARRNVLVVLFLFCVLAVTKFILGHQDMGHTFFQIVISKENIMRAADFIFENRWIILTALSTLSLLYVAFKNKFTDETFIKFQEEELHNIMILHKELFKDFVVLNWKLRKNITRFLDRSKQDGIVREMRLNMEREFFEFKYCIEEKSFKRRKKLDYSLGKPSKTFGYECIEDLVGGMKEKLEKFEKTSPFYSTAAINKYIRGLGGFDISWCINNSVSDYRTLLGEEEIAKNYGEFSEASLSIIGDTDVDDDRKIEALNQILKLRSEHITETVLRSVKIAVEIDTYIRKLERALKLKKRRKSIPLEQIVEKYRK